MTIKWTITPQMIKKFINQHELIAWVQQEIWNRLEPMDCGQVYAKPMWTEQCIFETGDWVLTVETTDKQPYLVGGL